MIKSEIAVASWSAGRLDVFGVGTNNGMFHRGYNGDWTNTVGSPCPAKRSSARLPRSPGAPIGWDVFALGTNNEILHRAWNGSAWLDWDALIGTFNCAPSAGSWGPNWLDAFTLGAVARPIPTQPDRKVNEMFHLALDAGAWRPWASGGAPLASASPPL